MLARASRENEIIPPKRREASIVNILLEIPRIRDVSPLPPPPGLCIVFELCKNSRARENIIIILFFINNSSLAVLPDSSSRGERERELLNVKPLNVKPFPILSSHNSKRDFVVYYSESSFAQLLIHTRGDERGEGGY